MNDGSIMAFNATEHNRLYSNTLPTNYSMEHIWSLLSEATNLQTTPVIPNNSNDLIASNPKKCFNIDTVADRADKYTRRQIKAALAARELENIIMRPGNRKYEKVCLPHFKDDCPVTASDFKAANDILGKNLGSIKGKTVHNKQSHVKNNIEPV